MCEDSANERRTVTDCERPGLLKIPLKYTVTIQLHYLVEWRISVVVEVIKYPVMQAGRS